MRKWVAILATGIALVTLLTATACTRSKEGPAPTIDVTEVVATKELLPTWTPLPGGTAIAGQTPTTAVSTPAGQVSPTPLPAMTWTPVPGTTPEATAVAGASPTPTPAVVAPTPVPGATKGPCEGNEFEYTVQTGDTLWGLATRFGTTVDAIRARNGLTSNVIYKGQNLVIPGTCCEGSVTHVVQPGENLFRISLKYGTTVEAISAANNIVNPSQIYAGQKLTIPGDCTSSGGDKSGGSSGGATGSCYHVVQPGETMSSIALRYGTTVWNLAAINGISNPSYIYAGQTLRVPC